MREQHHVFSRGEAVHRVLDLCGKVVTGTGEDWCEQEATIGVKIEQDLGKLTRGEKMQTSFTLLS